VTQAEGQELRRLTDLLKSIGDRFDVDQDCRAALQKAALALSLSFSHGLRPALENWYASLGTPLSEDADICFDWVSTRMMEGPAKSENAVFGSRATVSQ